MNVLKHMKKKRSKKGWCAIKIDICKTFDRLE